VWLLAGLAAGAEWRGRVVGVRDGDTIEVMRGRAAEVVRLHGVDCPELGQAYGRRAREAASGLAFGKEVVVREVERDQYGRVVGRVRLPGGQDLGSELLKQGLAWWFRRFAPRETAYRLLEEAARDARLGLWQDPDPTPPWVWRHERGRRGGGA